MKNFNISGVHKKIWFLGGEGGGVDEKPISWGDCLKRGAQTICIFKGGLARETWGNDFEERRGEAWYPNANYVQLSCHGWTQTLKLLAMSLFSVVSKKSLK